jgi:indole-3-glycerol phosphate synthase
MNPVVDFLEEVSAKVRERVAVQKAKWSETELKKRIKTDAPKRSFQKALKVSNGLAVIAELKQASPSAGLIKAETDIAGRIKAYTQGGAAALSILTEEDYFHGSTSLLVEVRRISDLPILRKDFICDSYQIIESKTLGADAILLITSLLPGPKLREFMDRAKDYGLETLVEIHDEQGLEEALHANASIIGINNRDLHSLRVDTANAARLLSKAPQSGVTYVVESGIKSPQELPSLKKQGAHAVLIGETLMRAVNPEQLIKEFVHACQK